MAADGSSGERSMATAKEIGAEDVTGPLSKDQNLQVKGVFEIIRRAVEAAKMQQGPDQNVTPRETLAALNRDLNIQPHEVIGFGD